MRKLTTIFKRGGADTKPAAPQSTVAAEPESAVKKLVVFDADQEIALINNLPMTLELKSFDRKPLNITVS